MNYTREDKLRICNSIVGSDEWALIRTELEEMISKKDKELEGYLFEANTHKSFLHQGIKIGLQLALGLPAKMQKDNQRFFDRMYQKVISDLPLSSGI